MKKTFLKAGAATAALLLCASLAWAVCETCRYADRGDRHEGVDQVQVSAASLNPLSIQYRQGDPLKTASDRLYVYFWLPTAQTPAIEVQEPAKNYMMHPVRKPYPAGLQSFSWPRGEVVQPLGLDPARLHARVSSRDRSLYFPAFLSSGPAPAAGGTYAFIFQSGAAFDARCTISRDDGGQLVLVRKWSCPQELGGRVVLEWNGRDDQGQPAAPGRYVLRVRGEMLTDSPRPLNDSFAFQHYGHLR